MKKIFCFTTGAILLISFLFNFNISKISAASFKDGLQQAGARVGYSTLENKTSLEGRVGQILSVATTFLGVVFLGLMIYAGFIWMMSRGNEQEVAKAKNMIIYAVIGLVVVLSAYTITKLFYGLWWQS